MPARREMLEVLQNCGVQPKAADDPHAASARAVARHTYRRRPGMGNQMLKFPPKAGSHHVLRRQAARPGREMGVLPPATAGRRRARALDASATAADRTIVTRPTRGQRHIALAA